jgi:site-specific recombinase XerD
MSTKALTVTREQTPTATDLATAFGQFLRLSVAEGDASPHTLRSYHAHAGQFVTWCQEHGIDPARATDEDIAAYRKDLVEQGYKRGTIAVKLSAVRRLYQAATWHGLRKDNPAEGVKAPREKTARAERIKYLPLNGLRRLLSAPEGQGLKATRDRVILTFMALHGLRVSEVAGLSVADVDLDAGIVSVTGKGRKTRTIYLTETSAQALSGWLSARDQEAQENESALFVALDNCTRGTAMTDRAIRYLVDGYLEALGLKAEGVSCHSLRHSAATWARAGGAKLDAIGDMLGHTSVTTTQVYAKIVDRMTENPAKYLEALLA